MINWEDLPFNKILISTIDIWCNFFILEVILKGHLNALFVGYSGAGKTVFIENSFSSCTTSNKW
jgi:type IV secretory pathway VirB4 component